MSAMPDQSSLRGAQRRSNPHRQASVLAAIAPSFLEIALSAFGLLAMTPENILAMTMLVCFACR
jgi:hypothetical protein